MHLYTKHHSLDYFKIENFFTLSCMHHSYNYECKCITSQLASPIIPGPGKGSTHSRGRSTSAPELSSSVALAPPSKGVGTSEELIVHISSSVDSALSARGGACKQNQTKPDFWKKSQKPKKTET